VTFVGISIILVIILIAICTLSFSMSESAQLDRRAMAIGLITLVNGLALGLGSALFLRTYKPEPYYGSFYVPVLTCAAAILVSFVGVIIGAVLLMRVWRAGRR
jgi:hypothetical protein